MLKDSVVMEKLTLSIPNISCGHCVMTIQRELGEIEGVTSVEGNLETKEITVEWGPPATVDRIRAALQEINYPAAE
jgi:copper chaperone